PGGGGGPKRRVGWLAPAQPVGQVGFGGGERGCALATRGALGGQQAGQLVPGRGAHLSPRLGGQRQRTQLERRRHEHGRRDGGLGTQIDAVAGRRCQRQRRRFGRGQTRGRLAHLRDLLLDP